MKSRTAPLGALLLISSLCFASGVAADPPPPRLLKNINPGGASSQIYEAVDVNGTFYFPALSEEFGKELWKSDGTKHGTVMVKDIFPGIHEVFEGIPVGISSDPFGLRNVGGTLYFLADTPSGTKIFKSDGTEAGTVEVNRYPFAAVGGRLFFIAGGQLYANDGTSDVQLTGHTPGMPPYDVHEPVAVGTMVYFSATDGTTSPKRQLWKTDGTVAGTSLVATMTAGREIDNDDFRSGALGSLLLFPVCERYFPDPLFFYTQCQLWRSDGTGPGTFALTNLTSSGFLGPRGRAVDAGSLAFFTLQDDETGTELWKTDGTVAGTGMVGDLKPGSGAPNIRSLVAKDGAAYFLIDEFDAPGDLGGLWRSDGTAAGTTRLLEFAVHTSLLYGYPVVNAGGTLLFRVEESDERFYLWRSDGTPGGTVPVAETFGLFSVGFRAIAVGGALFLQESSDRYGVEPMIYLASCGDGNVGTGEQCDSGAMNGLDGLCTTACTKVADVDDDGVLNGADNCPDGWNPGQEDEDGDGEGDACELCVAGGTSTKHQIKISKLDTPLADDKLTLKGIATISTTTWVGPDIKGAIVRIEDSTGAEVVNALIPAFEYDPLYRDGWKSSGGKSFTYLNRNVGGLLGITKVSLKFDLETRVLKFTVKGKDGSFAFDPMRLPLTGIVALDTDEPVVGQCAIAAFPNPPGTPLSCTLKPNGSSVKCK